MTFGRRRCGTLVLALAALAAPALPAAAAELQFSPILVEIRPGQRAATLEISNRGGATGSIQVRAYAWSQEGGVDRLAETDDLLLSPPIFTLGEGEVQVVRLVLRGGAWPGEAEGAFRVLVDELPPPGERGLRMALRVSLPVFAQPRTPPAEPELQWRMASEPGGGRVLLTARNAGRRRARFGDTALLLPGGRRLPLRIASDNHYALPGGERRWVLEDTALRGLPAGATLRVATTTEAGPLEANVTLAR